MKLKLIVDRIEENFIVFLTENGEKIDWPKTAFLNDVKEGEVYYFNIKNSPEEEKNKKEMAKEILNEILSN